MQPRPPPPREMRATDLAAIQTLWVAAWQATLPAEDFHTKRDWLAAHLAALHAAGAATLCIDTPRVVPRTVDAEGAPAGFMTWLPATGLVEQLAIHPAHARQGLGAALLAAARAARPQGLHLLVNEENPGALAFYRAQGFRVVERTTNPGGRRPVLRMAWP